MRTLKLILILSLTWLAVAREEVDPTSSMEENGEYPDELTIRMFPQLFARGKSGKQSTESRPIQKYWQSFVRNIPPLRWNVSNSLGNIFNTGAQSDTDSSVSNINEVNRNRKRKSSKVRKSAVKKNNSQKRHHHSRGNNYDYNYGSNYDPYNQLQLHSMGGINNQNAVHYYDPKTGQYYALNRVSSHNPYGHQNYYNPQHSAYGNDGYPDEEDNSYDEENNYNHGGNDYNYGEHNTYFQRGDQESQESGEEEDHSSSHDSEYEYDHPSSNNEYDNYHRGSSDPSNDYEDDVQVANDWGYTDEDIFGERKLKLSLLPVNVGRDNLSKKQGRPASIIKLQKSSSLSPKAEKDVMVLVAKDNRKKNHRRSRPKARPSGESEEKDILVKRTKNSFKQDNIESIRNVLGSYIQDDGNSRKRQQSTTKARPSESEEKDILVKRTKNSFKEDNIESIRNVLGSYIQDDDNSRKRQQSTTKVAKERFVERPRESVPYYFYPRFLVSP